MKTIKIFLGGGVKLLHGESEQLKGYRNDVIDPIISQLNSQEYANHFYVTKDYSDLTRNVVKGKHQEVYNHFIVHDAHITLFIIDGEIGDITKQEMDLAIASTKESHHPIVYIYGKNIEDNDEILKYLNQEGIYFQHFFDNRDLAAKIKTDLETSTKKIKHQRIFRSWLSVFFSIIACSVIFVSLKNCSASNDKIIDNCTAQLYLMRYKDINALSGNNIFNDTILTNFKYEDSVMTGNDRYVFPIISDDSIITTTSPFFRLKIHNKHRNTIVFIEAVLEIDQYTTDNNELEKSFIPKEINDLDIHSIIITKSQNSYYLKGFRQSVAYGETDDRYFFCVNAKENCSFRMRIRTKTQLGDYLYSNYIYIRYVK